MDTYNVIFTNEANEDLESIARYIALDNVYKALAFTSKLQEVITKTLSFFPNKYQSHKDCHMFPYGNYLVFYDICEKTKSVNILGISHSAQYIRYKKYF